MRSHGHTTHKKAHTVATFNDEGSELRDAYVFVRDGIIESLGPSAEAPLTADEVIDASKCVVIPGLVNTHHDMYQTLTRAIPAVQDAELFTWFKGLYPIWARMTPEMIHTSALTAMAELLLSGCTTSSDHLYLYPNGTKLDDTISAAQQIGMRFHAMRGSMSVGEPAGGLPPDCVVENQAAILKDSQRVVEHFHDANRYAMIRIDTLAMAGGAVHDPIASLIFCASPQAEYTIVNGRVVVREGRLTTLELHPHIARHNRMARELANGY